MSPKTRLKLGIALAVGGNVLFFTSAWIAWMPWSAGTKAALWGVLFFAPEAGTLLGAAIMGKENYEWFKSMAFALIGRMKPAGNIGEWRHRIGLTLFLLPLLPTYIQAYKPEWLPDASPWRWIVKICADLLFMVGLFVLGGDFWDKLHALFVREARAVFPAAPESKESTILPASEEPPKPDL